MRSVRAHDLALVTTGPSCTIAEQVQQIDGAFAVDARLCALRVFYPDRGSDEGTLIRQIASALPRDASVALTLVPVPSYGLRRDAYGIEAMGVVGPTASAVRLAADPIRGGPFVAGLRCGRYIFTAAQRASRASSLAIESKQVMEALGATLAGLEVGFADIVRMNRWYHAAGTKEAWAPSALAVAAFYREPGPVATAISLAVPFTAGHSIQIELMGMVEPDGTPLPKTHSWPKGLWDWPIHLPYKHGLSCGGLAFVGGQVSLDEHAEILDADRLDRQVARSLKNIDRVLEGLNGTRKRMLRLGAYYQIPSPDNADFTAASTVLRELAGSAEPTTLVGFQNLSYPQMRVEIEAIAELA
jgi:enamine deaminase RidA (YjgF/YER057c/UK114 family)